ncbi:MAG: TetR/AcrR family transcriptional regulator [Thermoleophilia bacterium]|nr:TetR/AcrR family transcriptional regulator [Thermoleophilia bacterium]
MSEARVRLSADERRAALLATALRAFSAGTYRGTTTAEIARAAGVTEPILYRHFESKQHLYLACLDDAWRLARTLWEDAIASEDDPADWLPAMGRAFHESREHKIALSNLWVQALAEASEDPIIRRYMRGYVRTIHEYVAGVVRRAQEAGGVLPDREPRVEAWIFIGTGLLAAFGVRLGGLIENDLDEIRAARREWLTGRRVGS